jgi:phosphoribosylaminoimidazolecarboxamide formyltransferase/IMP cyclohydrolase
MQLAGLASNRGRNLRHLHDRAPGGATLGVVVSNAADAPIVDWADAHGVPTEVVVQSDDESRRAHESRIVEALADYPIDLVCLDGYMRVLSETFLDAMPTTLNVHPSLLPAFPGMDAWAEALEAGVAVTGCTVHVVTNAVAADGSVIEADIDAGPIVTQEAVPVYADDDRASLKERVLHDGEFRAYPRAVGWFADGAVSVDAETNRVQVASDTAERFPVRRVVSHGKRRELRYGENPHQAAAVYVDPAASGASVVDADQLNPGAKALSYNNYNDADAALALVHEFEAPAAAVIKHANPAGCAVADTVVAAYDRALNTDAMSAFGGIVAINRTCDGPTAERIVDSYKEVVLAPGYTDDAVAILREREDLRVLDVGDLRVTTDPDTDTVEKALAGGRLVQDRDDGAVDVADLEVVTERNPTEQELETMAFAWPVVKHVKSNAIVLAAGTETVGVGMGQVSRVDAVRLATMKASEDAEGKGPDGAVMASDAFFPFPDGVVVAAEAGVAAVVQPGGSVKDDEVIEAADDHDMAMAFTAQRAFRHS